MWVVQAGECLYVRSAGGPERLWFRAVSASREGRIQAGGIDAEVEFAAAAAEEISKKETLMSDVIVVIGAGSIGQAIARRVSAGKHVLLADLRQSNADAAAEVLRNAGFDVSTATVDVVLARVGPRARRDRHRARRRHGVIHAAGVSPSQATPETILAVDLTAPRWCSRSSATSSRAAAPASSSRRSPGTASAR